MPSPHSKDRLFYGARVFDDILFISAEGEFIRSNDTEVFPSIETKDTTDKAKLGLRSTFHLLGLVSLFVRAGGEASRNHHEETVNSTTVATDEAIKYRPYAGAGVR